MDHLNILVQKKKTAGYFSHCTSTCCGSVIFLLCKFKTKPKQYYTLYHVGNYKCNIIILVLYFNKINNYRR